MAITMDTDWGAEGAQLSGAQVQKFIKDQLIKLQDAQTNFSESFEKLNSDIEESHDSIHESIDDISGKLTAHLPFRLSSPINIAGISPSSVINKNLEFTTKELTQIIKNGKIIIPVYITLGVPVVLDVELPISSISQINFYGSTTMSFKEASFRGGNYNIRFNLNINFISSASTLNLSNGAGQLHIAATTT